MSRFAAEIKPDSALVASIKRYVAAQFPQESMTKQALPLPSYSGKQAWQDNRFRAINDCLLGD